MLANGNGATRRCVANLLRTMRGECPMVRTKGLDREIIDSPASEEYRVKQDAEFVISTFEPRANLSDVSVGDLLATQGDLALHADLD